ncbi:MAG TPA: hypothetical protein PKI11_21245 [Candidatus Hydrogenedentes bacterium]|nr:hypothetical protein [Candidatus Hydrogenedentota bacterium]HNT87056.1 hypothetical protein [Candidatus Hydrogenedentota bacterium]
MHIARIAVVLCALALSVAAEVPDPAKPPPSAFAPPPSSPFAGPARQAPPVAPPPATSSEERIILNYWTHLNEILQNESLRRSVLTARPGGRYVPRKMYPFENIQHLRGRDLLRAVREGIAEARAATWGKSPEEVTLQIRRNIVTALEYYPLIAVDDRDLKPLLYALAEPNEEDELRLYLLRCSVPGTMRPSLFALYFQDALAHNSEELRKYLGGIVEHAAEKPRVQCAAIEAYFHFLTRAYAHVLKKDSAVAAFAEARGEVLRPEVLFAEGAPQPKGDVGRLLRDHDAQWLGFARTLAGYADANSGRAPELRETARAYLERIYAELPLSNRDDVKALLDRLASAPTPA